MNCPNMNIPGAHVRASGMSVYVATRRYVPFSDCCTFRFNFDTFRFGFVARFVLRIIVAFPTFIDGDFSCVTVSPYRFLADIKPGYDIIKKYYWLAVVEKSGSGEISAGASCPFLDQCELRHHCGLEIRLALFSFIHRLTRQVWILQAPACRRTRGRGLLPRT